MTSTEPAHLAGHDDHDLTYDEARTRVAEMTPAEMADVVDTVTDDRSWTPLRKVALAGVLSHARRRDVGVLPARGGHVEAWLRTRRDRIRTADGSLEVARWRELDAALDDLRDRSDIGAPWTGRITDPGNGQVEHDELGSNGDKHRLARTIYEAAEFLRRPPFTPDSRDHADALTKTADALIAAVQPEPLPWPPMKVNRRDGSYYVRRPDLGRHEDIAPARPWVLFSADHQRIGEERSDREAFGPVWVDAVVVPADRGGAGERT